MKICNKDELRLFEDTLEQCKDSVLVLTPEGDQYDLKNPIPTQGSNPGLQHWRQTL